MLTGFDRVEKRRRPAPPRPAQGRSSGAGGGRVRRFLSAKLPLMSTLGRKTDQAFRLAIANTRPGGVNGGGQLYGKSSDLAHSLCCLLSHVGRLHNARITLVCSRQGGHAKAASAKPYFALGGHCHQECRYSTSTCYYSDCNRPRGDSWTPTFYLFGTLHCADPTGVAKLRRWAWASLWLSKM